RGSNAASILAAIEHVVAAVLRPAILAVLVAARLLLAEAHRFDLVLARAEQRQHLLYAVGAALAEADVVFAAAALVGVALDQHFGARVVAQELVMRFDQRLVLGLDVGLVEVEVDL